ncbi:MAG: hypothetical protein H0W89_07385 [Candidatus Levybacteria bacterium]|nr:hypothetical protein [Candidatus Levybacteria bacterium]
MSELSQPISPEHLLSPEADVRKFLTPTVSRLAFAASTPALLEPMQHSISKDQKDAFATTTADNLPYAIANAVSLESRNQAPQQSVSEWNQDFWRNVQAMTDKDVSEPLRTERINAFAVLDIKLDNKELDITGSFNAQVDLFRKKYVDTKKSDIKQFARDIAKDCKNDDGSVDMAKLQTRLDAIEPVLAIFGTDNDINLLVKDFALADAVFTQSEPFKKQAADVAVSQLKQPLQGSEHTRIQALWEKVNQKTTRLETSSFEGGEILRYKPESIRIDSSTGEKVMPLFYVQGINGDSKLPWTLEALAKEDQREIIAISYTDKLKGSTSKDTLETIASGGSNTPGETEANSVITEMDSLQANEIIRVLHDLRIDQVDIVAESRGAIRLIAAMTKNPDLFRNAYLAHPAGLDNRTYVKSHLDAARQVINHAARKALGKVEKHANDGVASPRGRKWLRDPRGWRKEHKSVAHADVRGALAAYAKAYPDKQITIAGDKNDKAFLSHRLEQNTGKSENVTFILTDWGGHGIGYNPEAVKEISGSLKKLETTGRNKSQFALAG